MNYEAAAYDIVVRPTTLEDIYALYYTLRQQDRDEITAVHGREPTVADLWRSVQTSGECWTAIASCGRKPIAVFGCAEHDGVGVPWLLGSWLLDTNMIRCCKLAKQHVGVWLEKYGKLHNCTDKRNRRVLMWLRWLGFTLGAEVDVNGHPFIYFSRTSPCANPQRS